MNNRRNLKSRETSWASFTAQTIARTKITPNQISILSVVMSIIAMLAFLFSSSHPYLLLIAALFIQLRLLCNLFDGMIAIEYKKKSSLGGIYNDLPDRFADAFIILGLSFAVQNKPYAIFIGWIGVFFSVMTAYIRVLGLSLGTNAYFNGPMAKQHRMFFCTFSAILQYVFFMLNITIPVIYYTLYIIAVGALLTCFNRLYKISSELNLKHNLE